MSSFAMGLRGLLFARTWEPSPLYTSSAEELQAIQQERARRYEKCYNWARYLVAAVIFVVLFSIIGVLVSYYVTSGAPDYFNSFDGADYDTEANIVNLHENLNESTAQHLKSPPVPSLTKNFAASSQSKSTREVRIGPQPPLSPSSSPLYHRPGPGSSSGVSYRTYSPFFPPLSQGNANQNISMPNNSSQSYIGKESRVSESVPIIQGRHSDGQHQEYSQGNADNLKNYPKTEGEESRIIMSRETPIEERRSFGRPLQSPYSPNRRPPSSNNYGHSHSHSEEPHQHQQGPPPADVQHRHHTYTEEYTEYTETECGFRCVKDGKCVTKKMRCDGQVNCLDASDEKNCTCAERVGTKKLCDSLHDCPYGEDEEQCNGCGEYKFSCHDPQDDKITAENRQCIDISKRCDGQSDCLDGRDEKNCFRLGSTDEDMRGVLSDGMLQKMIGGKWYFICKRSESNFMLETISKKVCQMIVGDLGNQDPEVKTVPATASASTDVSYAFSGDVDSKFEVTTSCPSNQVISIKCPDPPCGWAASKYDESTEYEGRMNSKGGGRYKKSRYSDDVEIMGKVVGGYDSSMGEWPFLGAIYRNGTFHCGCSIIDKQWILTAAHCTHSFEKYVYEVQAGMMRRYSWSYVEQTRMVIQVHTHERYDKHIFMNDIALMKLDSPLYLSKWVTTACLAYEKNADPYTDQDCHVVGWGDMTEEGSSPDNLQEVKLPVKPCKETFTREAIQICAGYDEGGKDACQGDSGGPFICSDLQGRSVVHGIVSFGRGCARKGQLGVYTRVSAYAHWIDSILSEENAAYSLDNYYPKYCPGQRCHRPGGECIFPKMICDKKIDCIDGQDEVNCLYEDTSFATDSYELDQRAVDAVKEAKHAHEEHSHEADGGAKICHDTDEFQCKISKSCVPKSKRCDGRFDCIDNSDEQGCKCGAVIANAHPDKKCNSFSDCLDGGDEEYCAIEQCSGDPTQVKCPLDANKCIPKNRWCDGMAHCPYGEDEVSCFKIVKDKSEVPKDEYGFLHDKKTRSLTSGYVFHRQQKTEWEPLCSEEFGTDVNDLVCPYLSLGTSSGSSNSKNYKRNAPKYIERRLPVAREGGFKGRAAGDSPKCDQVKVTCGEPSCGERRLYSYSTGRSIRPASSSIGAHPWLALAYVNGVPKCKATLVSKQWAVASSICIREHVSSLKENYVTIQAGPYHSSYLFSSPMEQVKRVNYIDQDGSNFNSNNINGLTLLHMDKAIAIDHFATPICSNFENFSRGNFHFEECTRVSLSSKAGDLEAKYDYIQVVACPDGQSFCTTLDQRECLSSGNSFIYCSTDPESITAWYFVGFLGPQDLRSCNQNTNRIVINNPFFGSSAEKYQDLISSAVPPSVSPPPLCSGTRCTHGNCVAKPNICDSIQHCSDGSDESRCQRHYQMFRASDSDEEQRVVDSTYLNSSVAPCPSGHFRCESTYNCVPISSFCDGRHDCGSDDLTDEPEGQCNCRNYFQLIAPENICDSEGKIHCPDRSDEQQCPCQTGSFLCDDNNSTTSCIHPLLVCDNVKDCRNGRDESNCVALTTDLTSFHENKTATFTNGFVLHRVRNEWHPYCSNDWSKDLATAICRKELGYRALESLSLFELGEINRLQGRPTADDDDEDEAKNLLFWQKDEDVFGKYDPHQSQLEGRAAGDSFEDCQVAFIACSSP